MKINRKLLVMLNVSSLLLALTIIAMEIRILNGIHETLLEPCNTCQLAPPVSKPVSLRNT
jgi:hypothetical protein